MLFGFLVGGGLILTYPAGLQAEDGSPAPDVRKKAAADSPPPFVLDRETIAPSTRDGRRVVVQLGEPIPYIPPVLKDEAKEAEAAKSAQSARPRPVSTRPPRTQLLSVTATVYPEGWALLSWFDAPEDGTIREYHAWSRGDYAGLPLSRDFEVGDSGFWCFPMYFPQASIPRHCRRPCGSYPLTLMRLFRRREKRLILRR